jgi:hypothetical protein
MKSFQFKIASKVANDGQGQQESEQASEDAYEERIPGGMAEGKNPDDFNPEALAEGTRVEMEHTDDPGVAREIAMDHLVEDPEYYVKLRAIEGDGVSQEASGPMDPERTAIALRAIAANIDRSRRPHVDLVIRDLRRILATLSI